MKKIILVILVFLNCALFLNAQNTNSFTESKNNTIGASQIIASENAVPWVKEAGLRYNMPILARVYRNSVLFQPTGSLLGIFKDGKCWGYAGLGNSPVGPIFNVTIGYNNASATGFNYKVYDATTNLIYDVIETVNFTDGLPVGLINAPISINISGLSGLNEANQSQFNIFPNPVESEFNITFGFDVSKNTVIQLYNISGQLVSILYYGQTTNNHEFVIKRDKSIEKGIYFITVNNGLQYNAQKVLLK